LTGDLRYCLTQAQDKDSIQFAVKGAINLTRALPDLTRSLSIEGPGANLLTVRRNTGGFYGIFTVSSSATVSISGLTISNGEGGLGGGITNSGTLTISNSTISNNRRGAGAGGIFSSGALIISKSSNPGNGEGGISNSGTLTISNSTISRNGAFREGGGIRNYGGTLTVSNSDISSNFVDPQNPRCDEPFGVARGAGIFNSGTLTISGSSL